MDKEKIKKAIKLFIEGIGDNTEREGLKETPQRVADMMAEILSGTNVKPEKEIRIHEAENRDEMIIVKDIPFYSFCEHHILPFFGKVHIAYIPRDNVITGFGTMVRLVQIMSRRLQLQERMTTEICHILQKTLNPKGLLVVIEAEHLCITMRGVQKAGTKTTTSAMRGWLRNPPTRAEAFSLIKG